jgi:hypothetical protein
MRKLLLSAGLAAGLVATAQVTSTDVTVTMTSPMAGTNVEVGVPLNISGTITNNGTVALTPSDSIVVYYSINNQVLRNANNQVIGFYVNENIPVNGTTTFNRQLTFGNIGSTATANFCVIAIHTSAVDADSSNNISCQSLNFIAGTVSTGDVDISFFADNSFYSNGVLNIDLEGVRTGDQITVEVMNLTGQVVAKEVIRSTDARVRQEIMLNNRASGAMLYRITNSAGEILATRKFIAH